jgi:predicted nucleic acid-binding protein
MTFADIPSGTSLFVDANTFVYACAPDPQLGPPSLQLLERIEQNDLQGYSSAHVLSDVAHRLMSLEACAVLGWPYKGIARRLQRHPDQVQQLSRYRQAVDNIIGIGIQFIPIAARHIFSATSMSQQHGLLSGDALTITLMLENGLTNLASNDTDFDRVAGITRFRPV